MSTYIELNTLNLNTHEHYQLGRSLMQSFGERTKNSLNSVDQSLFSLFKTESQNGTLNEPAFRKGFLDEAVRGNHSVYAATQLFQSINHLATLC
ncbi:hypothetical protein [Rummeliibacillus pycnus]|uniref:hypothetical protein n=1 Tax=Rummeliibacillus pycnus TaxID=101070 RepID=UPI003D281E19